MRIQVAKIMSSAYKSKMKNNNHYWIEWGMQTKL